MDTAEFDDQLIAIVGSWSRHIRCGYSVHTFTSIIPHIMPEPSATQWGQLRAEIENGIHLSDALNHLLERVPSEALVSVVEVFHHNWEAEGNASDLAYALRDHAELLWDRYGPPSKPAAPVEDSICYLMQQLKSDDDRTRTAAMEKLIALQDHAVYFLLDSYSLGWCSLPFNIVADILKSIATEAAIINLKRYALSINTEARPLAARHWMN